jgi:glyoxylase I family protein
MWSSCLNYIFAASCVMCAMAAAGCTGDGAGDASASIEGGATRVASTRPAGDASVAGATKAVAVRYQVNDVERAVAFYNGRLGFPLAQRAGSAFAMVRVGDVELWLSGPKSSGSRPMPDGRRQEPGGWNRVALEVQDLSSCVERLRAAGVTFRNAIETGPGGSQIQIEDPDGNPIELFQRAANPDARVGSSS